VKIPRWPVVAPLAQLDVAQIGEQSDASFLQAASDGGCPFQFGEGVTEAEVRIRGEPVDGGRSGGADGTKAVQLHGPGEAFGCCRGRVAGGFLGGIQQLLSLGGRMQAAHQHGGEKWPNTFGQEHGVS